MDQSRKPEVIGSILERVLHAAVRPEAPTLQPLKECNTSNHDEVAHERSSRFDFDLAEFPLFRFHKPGLSRHAREPLEYTDTITGADRVKVIRHWKVYPGAFGFGGASTQELLFDLLQLYAEQGARGSHVQFGTLRSLFLRRDNRNPSKRDYERMRQDIDILRGYDFHCTNAFWDHKRQAYVDMKWRLFESVFFFKPHPTDEDKELPFGFLEVSSVLQEIAKSRGFFALGFSSSWFFGLRPMEQRLALYLSKKFVSQQLHRRFVSDLAKALPIEAKTDYDERATILSAAEGLIKKQLPCLAAFRFEKSTKGSWLAVFERRQAPKQDFRTQRLAGAELSEELEYLLSKITEAVGSDLDQIWWLHCAKRLGRGGIERGLGMLNEAKLAGVVYNPGGLLTQFFKDIAAQQE